MPNFQDATNTGVLVGLSVGVISQLVCHGSEVLQYLAKEN